MHRTVSTWQDFQSTWDGLHNFLLAGECLPFHFDAPPLEVIVDELRNDDLAEVRPGVKGSRLSMVNLRDNFRTLSLKEAMASSFGLAHFKLSRFDAPGRCLHGFKEQVLDPWMAALTKQGFTFDRCYPIIFISGKGCATNYHMDFSHVLAWQIYGTKNFVGLRDPDKYASKEVRLNYKPPELDKPANLKDDETLSYTMTPGTALWNQLLTPHWVEAADEVAMSFNISHGGLRYKGKLCRNEQELQDHRTATTGQATNPVKGAY